MSRSRSILACFGFRQGFIVGVLSFAGFALGAFLGTRLGPLLLPQGSSSPYAPAFGLVGALLAGAILAERPRGPRLQAAPDADHPRPRPARRPRSAPLLGAALALGIVWIVAAVAAQTPGQNGAARRHPALGDPARAEQACCRPRAPILNALSRLDPLPSITGPSPDVAAPPPRIARAPGVRAAARSVVRVLGTACGLAIEGSGWVAAPDVVVTNAHVVAGEQDTTVEVGGQLARPARARRSPSTRTTTSRCCASPDSVCRALASSRDPPRAGPGAILGYPENGPFDVQPGRIGRTQTVLTQDAYGHGPVSRLLTPLRGLVRPGNSGGPLVDGDGRVLTTVFAGTVGGGPHGGYGVANATVAERARGRECAVRHGAVEHGAVRERLSAGDAARRGAVAAAPRVSPRAHPLR